VKRVMNQLAVSLAGHDKGSVYAVVSDSGRMVSLADGKGKTLENPKKKNAKHIRRICHLPKEIEEELEMVCRDSDLVHVLRQYQAFQKEMR
jgi:hypothetical protein